MNISFFIKWYIIIYINLDYKQKYLKYKGKYLLAKAQQEQVNIINNIKKIFLGEIKLETVTGTSLISSYMNIIKPNESRLTEEKISLLLAWNVTDSPVGFHFETNYDDEIKQITKNINENDDENEDEFLQEALQEAQKNKDVEVNEKKKVLYHKLLSTIFDDTVDIIQFTFMANQPI